MGVHRICLASLLLLLLGSGCPSGKGQDPIDGGPHAPDGGAVPTGQPCPDGEPLGCAGRICLSGGGGQTYCSAYCTPGTCPTDFPCQRYLFADDGGAPADLRDVCAPRCERDPQCQSGVCDLPNGLCTPPPDGSATLGEPCGGSSGICAFGLVCESVGGAWICLRTCDPAQSPFCDDGTFCWTANVPGGGRCWPGGTSEVGDPCTDHLDCGRGLLCVRQGTEATCHVGCDPAGQGPTCPAGQTCLPLDGRTYGVCTG